MEPIIPSGKAVNSTPDPRAPLRTSAELGAALRAQRKAQGLTLEQLSGLSGLGMRFLSELERGKATAELGKTLEVAAILGLDCFLISRSCPNSLGRPIDDPAD